MTIVRNLLFCFLLPVFPAAAQFSFLLNESTWTGNHSPTMQGTKMLFFGDTLALFELDGIREPELFFYKERGDTLEISAIESSSITCTDQGPGYYHLVRSCNGEKIHFKPIQDACMSRFTRLVSESPWSRKREPGEWRPDWHFLSPENDGIAGIGLYEALRLLRFSRPKPIIVAVIDCPVDYSHPDLSPVMWKNPDEIPANKKDDDKNWYKDDVHGWFFNCSRDGKVVDTDQPEVTQVYQLFSRQFEGRLEHSIREEEKKDWQNFRKARAVFLRQQTRAADLKVFFSDSLKLFSVLQEFLQQSSGPITPSGIDAWISSDTAYGNAVKRVLKEMLPGNYSGLARYIRKMREGFAAEKMEYQELWRCSYNPECYPRAPVGDHPEIPNEKMYGCGHVLNPSSEAHGHGTHCAGIIAAKRGDGYGVDGIAEAARIMTLSAVPSSGDERDKDVANCIRYAADKGARIISMSFAKRFSPHKKVVDDAVRYAESKGCLFFHAAGNEHLDRDTARFYPIPEFSSGGKAANWIEVGNNQPALDANLVAPSSNYGKKTVDLFAPGTEILSTYPDKKFETMTGTSMACPVAAGVAALIWSHFPRLTAAQIKKLLMESAFKPDLEVRCPGTGKMQPFSSLSVSGGIVNARQAVVLADQLARKKR